LVDGPLSATHPVSRVCQVSHQEAALRTSVATTEEIWSMRRRPRKHKERPLFSLSFVGEMISTSVERAIPREPDGIVRRPQLSLKALQQIYQKDSLPGQRPHS